MSYFNRLYSKLYAKMDHTICMVTVNKRFMAYLVDLACSTMFMFVIPIYFFSILTGNTEPAPAMKFLNYPSPYGIVFACVAILMFIIYFVFIPLKVWEGQTLGKHMFGFKAVKTNDSKAGLGTLILREIVGVLIFEGGLYAITNVVLQLIALLTGFDLQFYYMIFGYITASASCLLVMVFQSRRMFHDYVAGTKVVPVEEIKEQPAETKEPVKKQKEKTAQVKMNQKRSKGKKNS